MPRIVVERGNEKGVSLNCGAPGAACLVGRSAQCQLVLTDSLVSRTHFQIEGERDLHILTDLQSHNGTFLNGARVSGEVLLCLGDVIRAGETLLSFQSDSDKNEGALAGQKIAGYHLLTRIGIGGMGEVYKATQIALGRQVALKILAPELTLDAAFIERFLSEARAAARLNHPNVIGVHEVGEDSGVYYLSMEYVAGGSVQDLIAGGRTVDPLRATEILLQAARALQYAERAGIVHRDVKPDNLMLTETGDVRLADLGIAKRVGERGKADQAEGVFGSPHYMAPEQARGLPLDHRADIYSLGATYYRMLTGKLPFTGKDAREIMEKQVFEEPEPLRTLAPHLPTMVYQVADRMMRKRVAERYPSAAVLIQDLEAALDQIRGGVTEDAVSSPTGRRNVGRKTKTEPEPGFFGRFFKKK